MIGIICAMTSEVTEVVALLARVERKEICKRPFWQGLLGNKKIVVALSGIGKVEAGITTILMIEHFPVSLVISCGIAGGYKETLKTLDVVVSDKVGYYDVDLTFVNKESSFGQLQGMPVFFDASTKFIESIKEAKINDLHIGTIMSADTFAFRREDLTKVFDRYQMALDVYAVDMESASIGHVCYQYHIPFVSIRTISDVVGMKQAMQYHEFSGLAARRSATIISTFIKNMSYQL